MTKSVEQIVSRAKSHFKKGQYSEAEALYAAVIMSFPNNSKAKQGLQSLKGISTTFNSAVPPQATVSTLMGQFNQKMLGPVVNQAQNLLRYYPKAIVLWNILGIASAQLSHFDQAIQAFEKIISISPDQASAYYNLGNVFRDKAQFNDAIDAYTRALELKPDYEEAYNNLSVTLTNQYKTPEIPQQNVIDQYEKLSTKKAENAEAIFNLGLGLYKEGKLNEALGAFRRTIEQLPTYIEAYNNIGVILQEQGLLEDAQKACQKAIAIKPDFAEPYNTLGTTLKDQGKLEEALLAFKKAISIKPDFAAAHNNMGVALATQGKLKEAIEAYNVALSSKPDFADAHNNTANVLKTQGKLKDSLIAYGKALSLEPYHAGAIRNATPLKVQLLDHPLVEHEMFDRLNNDKLELLKMPVFQILKAIEAFISGDKDLTQKHLDNYTNIGPEIITAMVSKDHIFCEAFSDYLSKLLEFPTEFLQISEGDNVIYHLGESHCLSFAHQTIICEGREHVIMPKITLGGKVFHFSSTQPNAYQEITKTNLFSLPNRSKVFISFGEIDCRHSEGVLIASKKLNKPISKLIENMIEDYLKWFAKQNKQKNHQLYFFNVPAPVYIEEITPELNADAAEVVMKFNSVISKYLKKYNFKLIDVYGVTIGKTCYSNLKYHIDGRHLGPHTLSQITPQLD